MNTLYLVPSIILYIAKGENVLNYDLSSVKCISTGGAPLKKEIIEKTLKRIPTAQLFEHYGMTESTTMCLATQPNSKPDSTGRLVPGMMAKVSSQRYECSSTFFNKSSLKLFAGSGMPKVNFPCEKLPSPI